MSSPLPIRTTNENNVPNEENEEGGTSSARASTVLQGHTADVLCLATWEQDRPFLASGSEDCTVRLWHDWQCRVILQCEGPVQALVFCPLHGDVCNTSSSSSSSETRETTAAAAFPPPNLVLLLATDNVLWAWNLNNLPVADADTFPIELSSMTSEASLVRLWQLADEINAISWTRAPVHTTTTISNSNKGSRKKKGKQSASNNVSNAIWIATADDMGQVCMAPQPWINASTTLVVSPIVLMHNDNQQGLCLTAALRTNTKKKKVELLSGGSDCRILQWTAVHNNNNNQWTPQTVVDLNAVISPSSHNTSSAAGGPLWNPPMVHALQWCQTQNAGAPPTAVAACGDGQVLFFQVVPGGRLVCVAAVEHAAVPVCAVTTWRSCSTVVVVSAGNDGICKVWNVGNLVSDAVSLEDTQPSLLQTIVHGAKPNAIVTTAELENTDNQPGREGESFLLWVADTTNNITTYRIAAPS